MAISEVKNGYRVDVAKRFPEGIQRFRKIVPTQNEAQIVEANAKISFDNGMTVDEIKAQYRTGNTSEANNRTLQELYDYTYTKRWSKQVSGNKGQAKNARLNIDVLGADTIITSITKPVVLDLLEYWSDWGNSDSTLNRKLSALMTMLEEGIEAGWLPESARIKVKRRAETRGNPCWLTPKQVANIIAIVHVVGKHEHANVFEFCVNTGLRISEALSLTVSDRLGSLLTVSMSSSATKKHNRNIPLTNRAAVLFEDAAEGKKANDKLFNITYESCRQVWDRYVRPANEWKVGDNYSIHILRHTFASLAMQNGVRVEELKMWLGHNNISTTLRYAKMTAEQLKGDVSKIEGALSL